MNSLPAIRAIRYGFPSEVRTVRELEQRGALESSADLLERFGFATINVATTESPYQIALETAGRLLAEEQIDPDSIEVLIHGGLPGPLAFEPAEGDWDTAAELRTENRFKYAGTRLAYDLGLTSASVIGLSQLACTTLFSAIRIARSFCIAGDARRVLCVNAEFYPPDAGRESLFNCVSDAGCALLVEQGGARRRVCGSAHVTKGYYWDVRALREEIVASYFPTARHVALRALADAGWEPGDVDWVIPHNVSLRSWEILMSLLPLPGAKLCPARPRAGRRQLHQPRRCDPGR